MPAAMPPAAMAPMLAMNHSAELKPMMFTHRCGPNPRDRRLFPNLGDTGETFRASDEISVDRRQR